MTKQFNILGTINQAPMEENIMREGGAVVSQHPVFKGESLLKWILILFVIIGAIFIIISMMKSPETLVTDQVTIKRLELTDPEYQKEIREEIKLFLEETLNVQVEETVFSINLINHKTASYFLDIWYRTTNKEWYYITYREYDIVQYPELNLRILDFIYE